MRQDNNTVGTGSRKGNERAHSYCYSQTPRHMHGVLDTRHVGIRDEVYIYEYIRELELEYQ